MNFRDIYELETMKETPQGSPPHEPVGGRREDRTAMSGLTIVGLYGTTMGEGRQQRHQTHNSLDHRKGSRDMDIQHCRNIVYLRWRAF